MTLIARLKEPDRSSTRSTYLESAMSKDNDFRAALKIAAAVLDAIEAAGPGGIPDGHLYMMLQTIVGQQWNLQVHQAMIEALVETGKITNHNHLLVAVKE